MGVVKNLWVRIGGDASGAVKSFKSASSAGLNAKESIKRSSAETKRSIRETFTTSVPSIKKYKEEVAKTRSAHQTATQNIDRLKDKISQLTGIYDTVKSATDGLDLSKPLSELLVDAEKNLTEIESKRKKIEADLAGLSASPKTAGSKKTADLQKELGKLAEKSRFAVARLEDLDRRAEQIGSANIGHASAKGLEQLKQQINTTKNEMNTTKMVMQETGQKLKSLGVAPTIGRALKGIGTAAAHAAGAGVKKLWGGLKSLAGSAVRGIASLPGKLLGIGKKASAGCGGLSKMVRSIRNLGIASLGMRVASGMFGRLRSVISSYISQNEELNASVTAMKNQMGEALAPAINLVLQAMQRLMPVVTAVSNAISSVFTALFGKASATGKAIIATAESAGAAAEGMGVLGFDQITKEEDNDSGGGSSDTAKQIAEQSAAVNKLTAWIQELKTAFAAGDWMKLGQIVGDGINSIVKSIDASGVGEKIGTFANNIFTSLHGALSTIDFRNIGATLGQMMSSAFQRVNWSTVGQTIGEAIQAIPRILLGLVSNIDWSTVGQGIATVISNIFSSIDWEDYKQGLTDGFNGILDLITGFASGFAPLQGIDFSAATTSLQTLWKSIWDLASVIGDLLAEAYDAVLKPIAQWTIEAAVPAAVDVFTAAFDALSAILRPVIDGLGGFMSGLKPVIDFIEEVAMLALEGLSGIFTKVGQVFTEKGGKVQEIVHGIGEVISAVWKLIEPIMIALKETVGAVFGFIGDIAGTAIGLVIDVLGGLIDFVAGVFTGDWGRAWDGIVGIFTGIVNAIKGVINGIIGFINGLISGVCSGINVIIRAMNKLKWDIPDWVPVLGGKTFGFNLKEISPPQIPLLAEGGIVSQPTPAIIGEDGKEAVMPLERNTGWITKLAQQINHQSAGGTNTLQLAIYFRSRKLAEYVVQDINQITRETGVCPIYI